LSTRGAPFVGVPERFSPPSGTHLLGPPTSPPMSPWGDSPKQSNTRGWATPFRGVPLTHPKPTQFRLPPPHDPLFPLSANYPSHNLQATVFPLNFCFWLSVLFFLLFGTAFGLNPDLKFVQHFSYPRLNPPVIFFPLG